MRRVLVAAVVFCFLFLPSSLVAQVVEIVPQIGLTYASYSGDEVDSSAELGFSAGGKLRIGNPVYVDGGVFWTATGGELTEGTTTDAFLIRSIRFPVTVGIRLLPEALVNVRLFAGGAMNLVTGIGDTDLGLDEDDVKNNFSGRVGAGADLLIIAVDAAYEFGLSDVFEESAGLGSVKQRGLVAEVGVRLAI